MSSPWWTRLPIPSSIQCRFISFILQRSLGHFVLPGQLDISQVDSQISKGFIQLSDVLLNPAAFDQIASSLALPLHLHSGHIRAVTAKIPWPYPLSSPIGLVLDGLSLVFHLAPPTASRPPSPSPGLADSVASLSDSFVHDALSPQEEAELRDSFVQPQNIASDLERALDPFLTEPSHTSTSSTGPELNPAGVPVFASLIERLLARFQFDATNLELAIEIPDKVRFVVSVQEIQYRDLSSLEDSSPKERDISVGAIHVSLVDLATTTSCNSPQPSSNSTPRPDSPADSEDLDEHTHLMMSQSLAFLPTTSTLPHVSSSPLLSPSDLHDSDDNDDHSSVASSLYQSAVSDTARHEHIISPNLSPSDEQPSSGHSTFPSALDPSLFLHASSPPETYQPTNTKQEIIFCLDRERLHLRVTTPYPSNPPSAYDNLKLTITSGVAACALKASHIRQLNILLTSLGSRSSTSAAASKSEAKGVAIAMDIDLSIKGIVFLLLSDSSATIDEAFWTRPLSPPVCTAGGYIKVWLQDIGLRHSLGATAQDSEAWISDISVFAFGPDASREMLPMPVLITDPYLLDEVSTGEIEAVDWTQEDTRRHFGARASMWRSKGGRGSGTKRSKDKEKAVRVVIRSNESMTNIFIVPLHLFIDLGCSGVVKDFSSSLASEIDSSGSEQKGEMYESDDDDQEESEEQKERKRLERLVLEDLDLELDYGTSRAKHQKPKKRKKRPSSSRQTTLHLSFLRIQARCPRPSEISIPRSGSLIINIRGAELRNGSHSPDASRTRFALSPHPPTKMTKSSLTASCVHITASLTPFTPADNANRKDGKVIAYPFFELGSLASMEEEDGENLKPLLTVANVKGVTVLDIAIPSLRVNLTKEIMDGLQYWADDATQALDHSTFVENTSSADTSVIGSRFFTGSRKSDSAAQSKASIKSDTELVIKLNISEAALRLDLPRTKGSTLPFETIALDTEVLVEMKPEGKSSTPKPLMQLRFISISVPETGGKESKVQLNLWGLTFSLHPETSWMDELATFLKAPPGAFESVIPTERTKISIKIADSSIRLLAPTHPGVLVIYLGDAAFKTEIVGGAEDSCLSLTIASLAVLFVNDKGSIEDPNPHLIGVTVWTGRGFAPILELTDLQMTLQGKAKPQVDNKISIDRTQLQIHLCADSLGEVTAFIGSLASAFKGAEEKSNKPPPRQPTMIHPAKENMMASIEDMAFRRVPEIGPAPDMINDDLPTNPEYLDESFGAAAGLRELCDEDLDDFHVEEEVYPTGPSSASDGLISKVGGETIKMLSSKIKIVENHFNTLPEESIDGDFEHEKTTLRLRVRNCDVRLYLHDGYDWVKTRKTIEDEMKEMKRRFAKIRQLVASGQTQDPNIEGTSAVLFNSVYIGLNEDVDELEPGALIAAIDRELKDDEETASQSSWQSFQPSQVRGGKPGRSRSRSFRVHGKRLTRSKSASIEFKLLGTSAQFDQYSGNNSLASRLFATVENLEIIDRMKSSTWKKFLTQLRADSAGNIRETGSSMVRIELKSVRPVPGHPSEEARLRAKILPLRLYVDQDALDFLKKFFSFKDPHAVATEDSGDKSDEIYFQAVEVFPVDLKLDYKPRRVDYRALREGRTIELMNFFHFDGAEMTLRHITLNGITGWPRMFDLLNDLWTPDVKATQLVEVISGVAPIRSVVNVGSGVADLVLLPIAQYKKDGRVVRGVQKGTQAFVKSTAIEAIKLGARLATGTQVILEQAEGVLGGQFKAPVTAEALQAPADDDLSDSELDKVSEADLFSKYAQQPADIREGVQSAYHSLRKNFHSAAQTILAVPMEVYERQGSEGPVRSVIRAVPIAVLKPMIGASEAISKTLLGLHNTLDPEVRHENEAKYKHR